MNFIFKYFAHNNIIATGQTPVLLVSFTTDNRRGMVKLANHVTKYVIVIIIIIIFCSYIAHLPYMSRCALQFTIYKLLINLQYQNRLSKNYLKINTVIQNIVLICNSE